MKKALLALILLAVVLGVSYYKTLLSEDRYDTAYEDGLNQSAELQASSQARIDSLGQLIVEIEKNLGGLLRSQMEENQARLDALNDLLAQEKKEFTEIIARQTKMLAAFAKKVTGDKRTGNHAKILNYYKKRFADLPTDLSDYEKKVARSEIRQETVAKFSISTAELDRIRKQYNLRY